MNTFWSENIQGVDTLYLSRKLRFHDRFKRQYTDFFRLGAEKKLRVLEIGCGPGALAGALHRWYPNAEITAVDRDSRFIGFARENEPGIEFVEGDATQLPFADETFDATISNTVSEHVSPAPFYFEQRRVLKQGGICLVLSARKGIRREAECLRETAEEKAFWESLKAIDIAQEYGVGRYAMTEQELPRAMEAHGFSDVSTGYAVIPLTPDDACLPREMAEHIIEAERRARLEAVFSTRDARAKEIADIVNAKFDVRLAQLHKGEKQWDTDISITMMVRGIKNRERHHGQAGKCCSPKFPPKTG